jgi:hypothetical protein
MMSAWKHGYAGLGLVSWIALSCFACGVVVVDPAGRSGAAGAGGAGTTGTSGTTGTGATAAIPCDFKSWDACDACVESHCLSQCGACNANAECIALVECAISGDLFDGFLKAECANAFSQGVEDALPIVGVEGCAVLSCEWECGASWYEPCFFSSGKPDCDKCVASMCTIACNECEGDAECLALVTCIQACPANDAPCAASCASEHPDGAQGAAALTDPVSGCVATTCAAECSG